jgi:hypothetical protein
MAKGPNRPEIVLMAAAKKALGELSARSLPLRYAFQSEHPGDAITPT